MVSHPQTKANLNTNECTSQALASPVVGVARASVCLPVSPFPPVLGDSSVPRRSKGMKRIRKNAWAKEAGGYVDLASYYFSSPDDEELVRSRLNFCMRTWYEERKADLHRYRGVGCGDRERCPVCASYYQSVLANEAVASILAAEDGVEIGEGVELLSFGLKLDTTLPAVVSERLDALLLVDSVGWRGEQDKFFKLNRDLIAWCFGAGGQVGGTGGSQLAGESSPTEPHYHCHNFIFPASRKNGVWRALPRFSSKEDIKALRDTWTEMLNGAYGLELVESDLKLGYLGSRAKLSHYIHYLYRHLLADLWAGWAGVQDGEVVYRYDHGRKEKLLSVDEMARLGVRIQAVPSHFRRIRSFGFLSDGQRGLTMRSLSLEPVEIDEDGKVTSEKWERVSINRFVRFVREGVVLRQVFYDEVEADDGYPIQRERLGSEFTVLDADLDCRPSGVVSGKRKRWQTPGKAEEVSDG